MTGDEDVPVVVVTGANGLVGNRLCRALRRRGATVRAVVRRPGTAVRLEGVEEHPGDFTDPTFAAGVVIGADAVVTTAHPMGSEPEVQHRVAVEGTPRLARVTRDAGVDLLVHVSTAAVYDRSPGVGDVHESSPLVRTSDPYARAKRDTDLALATVEGLTRVLARPAAILGAGGTSWWNTLRPARIRDEEPERHTVPWSTFAWVHVDDLAELLADLATRRVPTAADPDRGPVPGACTAVNVATSSAVRRDYLATVTDALGVHPVWDDQATWTGRFMADRARAWGWSPRVPLEDALAELDRSVRALAPPARSGLPVVPQQHRLVGSSSASGGSHQRA